MTQFSKKKRDKHMATDGSLKLAQRRFFRADPTKRHPTYYPHRGLGINKLRDVLQFWNEELKLSDKRLTMNMARKTFCTFGHHHTAQQNTGGAFPLSVGGANGRDSPRQPQPVCRKYVYVSDRDYVCNAQWDDPEEESHISRIFNLWQQGHHQPSVGSSTRDVLEMISPDKTN